MWRERSTEVFEGVEIPRQQFKDTFIVSLSIFWIKGTFVILLFIFQLLWIVSIWDVYSLLQDACFAPSFYYYNIFFLFLIKKQSQLCLVLVLLKLVHCSLLYVTLFLVVLKLLHCRLLYFSDSCFQCYIHLMEGGGDMHLFLITAWIYALDTIVDPSFRLWV